MNALEKVLWCAGAYLLGSISFSYFITKRLKGIDLRTVGSGNLGATNAGRVLGKGWGLAIYALDLGKGWVAVAAPELLFGEVAPSGIPVEPLAGMAVIIGHILPFYLRFKGGKGVATGSGVVLAISWPAAAAGLLLWFVFLKLLRMVSAASILAALSLPLMFLALDSRQRDRGWYLGFLIASAALVVFMHRRNIARIVAGTEPKTGQNR